MTNRKKIVILGSKEFPMGINKEDAISSGGIEIYVQSLADRFRDDDDFEIIIITRRFKGMQKTEMYASNITVYYVPWVNVPLLRNLVFNLFSFIKTLSLKPDYVFGFGVIGSFFTAILKKIKGIPAISAPCGISYTQPQYNFLLKKSIHLLEHIAYKKTDVIVYLSEKERENFINALYKPKKYIVVPMGAPEITEDVKPAEDIMKIKGSEKAIVFLGRLIDVKRVDTIIKAVNLLERDDFTFFVVGSGPKEEKLKEMAKGNKNIKFMGFRNDAINILRATDIFILSSESEGTPVAMIEAYSCRCACIVSDIGLFPKDGNDALLFKTGDHEDLKGKIEKLLDDKDLRDKLSKNAKKLVEKEFSWDVAKKKYVELFSNL